MFMKREIQWVAAFVVPLMLASCAGVSSERIDHEKASDAVRTAALRPAIVACMQSRLNDLGENVRITENVSPGVTRIDIGENKSGAFQYFYRLDILEMSSGSNVTVRKAPAPFPQMNQAKLEDLLSHCAPPI